MNVPLEISYRNVVKTDTIDNLIRDKAAKLDRMCDHLVSCRVAVERPHQHQQSGRDYRVRINLKLPPGHELVIVRESTEGVLHQRLDNVIREAFNAAQTQVRGLTAKQSGRIKRHPEQEVMGIVENVFPEDGYGFIRAADGHQIYFHENSVLQGDFERLVRGTGVRYSETEGDNGWQASTVQIVDKPGAARSDRAAAAGAEM
jgi:cold shock CspA family protein/ribosome-associated translation inhibitor RaiA